MDTNATGRFITELRKEKGYTQKELAEKLSVTDKAVSRWETGKGLPDTSLLKPLGDILGVSVSELLSGERIEGPETKEQTDKIILESLNYSKRMMASAINIMLFIVGVALAISPLYLATSPQASGGQNYVWILGLFVIATAILYVFIRKSRHSIKTKNKVYYLAAVIMQVIALVLEILPIGVVMVFASGPEERTIEIYSYFSLLPVGYANVTPMLTGILTIAVILLGVIGLLKFENAKKIKKAAFICSIISLLFSIVPLFLFGAVSMNVAGYLVFGAILLSICLQAVANRQE